MRGAWIGLTSFLLLTFGVFSANAQTVSTVEPSILGQSIPRASVRINISSGSNIADGLTLTISNDSFDAAHQGSWIYEFDTGGGLNNGSAMAVNPPSSDSYEAFLALRDQINADPSVPFYSKFYTDFGWFLLIWKFENEWGLSGPSTPPTGLIVTETGDSTAVTNIADAPSNFRNFLSNSFDTARYYLQLQGTGLTTLNNGGAVKLRHDVFTSEVYNGAIRVKDANAATVAFSAFQTGTGSPPTFPSVGEYDLLVDTNNPVDGTFEIVIDKAVTVVDNLLDDATFRVHATGTSINYNWNFENGLLGVHWLALPYPDTDGIEKGSVNQQLCPRLYPFPTGPAADNTVNPDNEYAGLTWSTDDGIHKLWQTNYVDFTSDTTLKLTGLWAAGADQLGMEFGAQLRAGDENGTIIAETPPGQKVITPFNWTDFSVSGVYPNGTTEVTVVIYGDSPTTNEKAIHVDNLILQVDNDHPTPPSITGMTTPAYAETGDTGATITLTGTNLTNGQTSVTLRAPDIALGDRMEWADVGRKLVDDDDDSFAAYEFGTGDTVVLTSGPGVILGAYEIAAKDNDQVITLVDDINGGDGDIGEAVTGYIVKAPIVAGSVAASGAQATATFDLTDAPTGYRNIIVEVGTHDPIVWREGFNVVGAGPNLANGSFELPESFQDCVASRVETFTPASDWKARFWGGYMSGPNPILQYRDDQWGADDFPSCPDPALGIHYHSTSTQTTSGTAQFYQTVTSTPSSTYTLSGFFANRSEGGASNSVTLKLLDGDSSAAPMPGASVEVLSEAVNGGTDWTFAWVEGISSADTMTASWEVQGKGNSAPHTAYADGLILEECTQPITLTGIDPPAVDNATVGPILLTITGSGFSGASPEVIFATQGQTIFGTNVLVVNDTTLTCEVSDLPAPGAVAFDVIVRSNGCIDSLIEGFVSAPTTIANPGFEEPVAPLFCGSEDPQDPRIPNLEPVSYWNFSDELIREGVVQFPLECPLLSCACPEATTGCDGGHYASMSTGEGEDEVAWQALKVDASAGVVFGGWFSWGGVGNVNIKLVDGYGPDGTLIASTSVPEGNDWCFSSVEGFALSEVITIVWELVDTVNGSPAAVHADSMTFEFSICNDPFADADADGDVDGVDFALFQLCSSGSGNAYPTGAGFEYCQCFDRDGVDGPDGDVDQGDFAAFAGCSSGPDVPADPACDD